jgi:hypothetical protein
MIRQERFLISQRLYAVRLNPMNMLSEGLPGGHFRIVVPAVWFRRRHGMTIAVAGDLWDLQDDRPGTVEEALARHDDGRYGGDWRARLDDRGRFFTAGPATAWQQQKYLTLLRQMLDHYPAAPDGWDGWWRF